MGNLGHHGEGAGNMALKVIDVSYHNGVIDWEK